VRLPQRCAVSAAASPVKRKQITMSLLMCTRLRSGVVNNVSISGALRAAAASASLLLHATNAHSTNCDNSILCHRHLSVTNKIAIATSVSARHNPRVRGGGVQLKLRATPSPPFPRDGNIFVADVPLSSLL